MFSTRNKESFLPEKSTQENEIFVHEKSKVYHPKNLNLLTEKVSKHVHFLPEKHINFATHSIHFCNRRRPIVSLWSFMGMRDLNKMNFHDKEKSHFVSLALLYDRISKNILRTISVYP